MIKEGLQNSSKQAAWTIKAKTTAIALLLRGFQRCRPLEAVQGCSTAGFAAPPSLNHANQSMPIPPPPRQYHCPACHWSKIVAPRSDVLMPGHDTFHSCPKCGHAPLDSQAADGWAAGVGQALDVLTQWLKR